MLKLSRFLKRTIRERESMGAMQFVGRPGLFAFFEHISRKKEKNIPCNSDILTTHGKNM